MVDVLLMNVLMSLGGRVCLFGLVRVRVKMKLF